MEQEQNEKRIALIGIIVSDGSAVNAVNSVLHDYGGYILGRLGLPIRDRGINAISIVLDAPTPVINALTGKLGAFKDVSAKALFEKIN